MGEQVLSDDVLSAIAVEIASTGATMVTSDYGRAVERATIAALAARSGVDVEALATDFMITRGWAGDADPTYATMMLADALRLALAQQEARHAEREAMWRELRELENETPGIWTAKAALVLIPELRRALGLESGRE